MPRPIILPTHSGGSGSTRALFGSGAGQSNFAAQNSVNAPSYRTWPASRIQINYDDLAGNIGFEAMNPPFNTRNREYNSGGTEFAQYGSQVGITCLIRVMHALQESTGETVFCLENGFGGRSIPNWVDQSGFEGLWDEFVAKLADAKGEVDGLGLTWDWLFHIWNQGESDATNTTAANAYQANESAYFTNLLARPEAPSDLKIYSFLIHTDMVGSYPHLAIVNAAKQANAAAFPNNVEIIDVDSVITTPVANGHFNYDQQDLLGQHIATKVLSLV